MSALPPKADIAERDGHVRFVPKAGSCSAAILIAVRFRGLCPVGPQHLRFLDFRPSVHHIVVSGHMQSPGYPRHFAQALLQPARRAEDFGAKRLISISPSSGGGTGSGLSTTAR
jgi:hypothetical protein